MPSGLAKGVQHDAGGFAVGTHANAAVTVLAVNLSNENLASLKAIFSHSRWGLYQAKSCAEVVSFLDLYTIPVIITEENLPDGTWRDLLAHGASLRNPPKLIVAAAVRSADDHLRAEALNLGACDVLTMPFRAAQVFHSVSLAWRRWKDRSLCGAVVSAAAAT